MEDMFLYSKSEITLDHIAGIADEKGYRHQRLTFGNHNLNIYYNGSFWVWDKLREEDGGFDGFEPRERAIIAAYAPVSAFAISFHPGSMTYLADFLEAVLSRYGGWVGFDTDDFEPVHTLENIHSLPFPYTPDMHS